MLCGPSLIERFQLPRDEYVWPVFAPDENVRAGEPAGKCAGIVYE